MKFCFRNRDLQFTGKTLIMAILNVTPDSFSDGGRYINANAALEQCRRLLEQGADVIDIGGESTRPGSTPVLAEEEIARVVPVVKLIRKELGEAPIISVDTTKPEVADAALAAGGDIVNDVSALDVGGDAMCDVLRKYRAGCVLMHPGECTGMEDIANALEKRLEYAVKQTGLDQDYFMLDTGIGFGKTLEQNAQCSVEFDALSRLERPILVGASRKSFLGAITGRAVDEREYATVASTTLSVVAGADMVRVHNVAAAKDAIAVASFIHKK